MPANIKVTYLIQNYKTKKIIRGCSCIEQISIAQEWLYRNLVRLFPSLSTAVFSAFMVHFQDARMSGYIEKYESLVRNL